VTCETAEVRVLVCPDKFAGTLSAPAAAAAIAAGWRDAAPADEVVVRPLSDGGPGFLDALEPALGSAGRIVVPTVGPLGEPVDAPLLLAGDTAYLEAASACGLHLVEPGRRDPTVTTTYGVGGLVAAAVERGVRTVVIGLGGSATNDGGAGLLAALGAAPVDVAGRVLPYGGAALAYCTGLGGPPRLRGVTLVGACDVDSPLVGPLGASAVFGPQKGASAEQVGLLDAALTRFAAVLAELPSCPPGLAGRPGAGAAGGLGAAILAVGGRLTSGIDLVTRAVGLAAALDACDLVITGEGAFDEQSLRGKVVAGVAAAARRRHRPCLVLAGRVEVDAAAARAAGVTRAYGLVEHRALADPAGGLRSLAAHVARSGSPGRPAGPAGSAGPAGLVGPAGPAGPA
jgi:glycerate kinase